MKRIKVYVDEDGKMFKLVGGNQFVEVQSIEEGLEETDDRNLFFSDREEYYRRKFDKKCRKNEYDWEWQV